MRFFILFSLVCSFFVPSFAYGDKKYTKKDFEKIKLMKIEYLNKRINCVKASNDFKEMKKCWERKKKY